MRRFISFDNTFDSKDDITTHFHHLAALEIYHIRVEHSIRNCTITHQALSSKQPIYLYSLLTPARQPRQLRSSNSNLLYPSVKTYLGTRAFSVAAPTLWNSLPVSVKSVGNITTFRRKLKTCLSSIAPQRTNPTVYNWNY